MRMSRRSAFQPSTGLPSRLQEQPRVPSSSGTALAQAQHIVIIAKSSCYHFRDVKKMIRPSAGRRPKGRAREKEVRAGKTPPRPAEGRTTPHAVLGCLRLGRTGRPFSSRLLPSRSHLSQVSRNALWTILGLTAPVPTSLW